MENKRIEASQEGDLISRKAAIEVLGVFTQTDVLGHTPKQIVEALSSAQPEPKWIPCSERLPFAEYGESDNVLATCELRDADDTSYRWVKTLYFNGGVWCYPTGETYEQKVIAWMPLPEPYKGKQE